MTPELIALGRRAVACPGWRWMPGMLLDDDESEVRIVRVCIDPDDLLVHIDGLDRARWLSQMPPSEDPADDEDVPDFFDHATRGCLLALVREAWSAPFAHVYREGEGDWWFDRGDGREACSRSDRHARCCVGGPCMRPVRGPTEADALTAALEAAPRRVP